MKKLVLISIFCCLLASCHRLDTPAFISDNTPRLEVDGRRVLVYDPLTCQLSASLEPVRFRVQTDNTSYYFALTLGELPVQTGQTINGSIRWTTNDNLEERNNIALEVIHFESDTIWLWNETKGIACVVRLI